MHKKYQYFIVFIHLCLSIPCTVCVTETATMYLPHNGKSLYTKLMQGDLLSLIPKNLDVGSPIVASHAEFNDGVSVLG